MSIIIVDDEKEIADLVDLVLKNEGYETIKFYDSVEAFKEIQNNRNIDLAVLDVMMPGMDGFELCVKIRESHTYPIIMLTARVEDVDKITGLSIGADDYMTKPFNPLELLARVKAQLRRYKKYDAKNSSAEIFEGNGLIINKHEHSVMLFEEKINLTPTEFDILWLLCENAGNVVSSESIFEAVWKEDYLDSNNTVMVHIRRIREKLKEPPRNPRIIKTVWGEVIKLKNSVIRRYITRVLIYTVAFVLFIIVMDNVFNGAVVDYLYSHLPINLFIVINSNRTFTAFFIYVLGLVIISVIYVFRLSKLLELASDSISEDESGIFGTDCPEELKDFSQKLKDFKFELKENERARALAEQQKNDLIVYLALI